MNQILKTYKLIILSLIICSSSFTFSQKNSSNFKVMTYNIQNGFNWGKDSIRHKNVITWIKKENPDVLALQELCAYNEDKLKEDAAKWGHPFVKILKTEGYPVGLTSKKPIEVKHRVIDELHHGMLHCETYGIDFFVLHLSPHDCYFRHKEAKLIANKITNCGNDKYIILGDFNAHSPFDAEALKQNKELLKKYRNGDLKKNKSNLRFGEFDYTVLSTFLSLPSIDVCMNNIPVKERYTYPSPVLIGKWLTADEVLKYKERIDYILTSPLLAKSCINSIIYHNQETDTFSDHYPVMAEFE